MDNCINKESIIEILSKAWSLDSSSKWTINNPAKGQCGVTALVINDLFGGMILKTELVEGWHFYNQINNQRYDFTESQFKSEILYQDIPSNREEAILDTNQQQYDYLRQKVNELWNR